MNGVSPSIRSYTHTHTMALEARWMPLSVVLERAGDNPCVPLRGLQWDYLDTINHDDTCYCATAQEGLPHPRGYAHRVCGHCDTKICATCAVKRAHLRCWCCRQLQCDRSEAMVRRCSGFWCEWPIVECRACRVARVWVCCGKPWSSDKEQCWSCDTHVANCRTCGAALCPDCKTHEGLCQRCRAPPPAAAAAADAVPVALGANQ
jgi:hypothetical protein